MKKETRVTETVIYICETCKFESWSEDIITDHELAYHGLKKKLIDGTAVVYLSSLKEADLAAKVIRESHEKEGDIVPGWYYFDYDIDAKYGTEKIGWLPISNLIAKYKKTLKELEELEIPGKDD